MRTRLELVSSGTIDMYDDVPISLNFSIADIAEPDKRNASYSKTIKLPGTANNNKLFGHIFEVDIYSNFNPNLKSEVILYSDGIENMRGFLRLTNVTVTGDKIEYECTIIGNVGNLYTAMGDKFLTDINLSAYNHTYNKTSIVSSWSAAIGVGYVYPMIDNGYNNGSEWKITDFFPAIYVKQYIDSIFLNAGFTYTSNFFNSTLFKSLCIPYVGGTMRLSESIIVANSISVASNLDQVLSGSYVNINFQTETSDPSNLWSTNVFKPLVNATYSFAITVIIDSTTGWDDFRLIYYPPGVSTPITLLSSTVKFVCQCLPHY